MTPLLVENSGDEELEILQSSRSIPASEHLYRHKAGADIARMEMFEHDGTLIARSRSTAPRRTRPSWTTGTRQEGFDLIS